MACFVQECYGFNIVDVICIGSRSTAFSLTYNRVLIDGTASWTFPYLHHSTQQARHDLKKVEKEQG
jgi:hypothetical protein